jgi:hypothetical protein
MISWWWLAPDFIAGMATGIVLIVAMGTLMDWR